MRRAELPVASGVAADSVDVLVRVVPRAGRESVGPERGGRLIVRTRAVPVDDQANEAVGRALARHFGVRRRDVHLLEGGRARDKTFRVNGIARTARLAPLTVSANEALTPEPRRPRRRR